MKKKPRKPARRNLKWELAQSKRVADALQETVDELRQELTEARSLEAAEIVSLRLKLVDARNRFEALKSAPMPFSQTQVFNEVG